jgi:hypothetical protein
VASLLERRNFTAHSELVRGLSGPTGGAPACNGFHSFGIAEYRLCAARTR